MAIDTPETPSLAAVIDLGIANALEDLNVCLPGIIESYNSATGMAKVAPAIKKVNPDGSTVALPLLLNVPVVFPRWNGGMSYIHFPLKSGDNVTLVFSQRSLDEWKSFGGVIDPDDVRMHHLSDAFAFVGGYERANPISGVNDTDLIMQHEETSLSLSPGGMVKGENASSSFSLGEDGSFGVENAGGTFGLTADGKFKYTNAATDELVSVLIDLFTDVQGGATSTSLGPQPLIMAQFAAHLTKLQAFKG